MGECSVVRSEDLRSRFEELVSNELVVLVKVEGSLTVFPEDSKSIEFVHKLIDLGIVKDVFPVMTDKTTLKTGVTSISNSTVRKVYKYILKKNKLVTTSEIAESLRLSKSTVRKALRELVVSGKIVRVGLGPGTKYRIPKKEELR